MSFGRSLPLRRLFAVLATLCLVVLGGGVMALPALAEEGTQVYVNLSSGDDAKGEGSAEAPYKTISKAVNNLGSSPAGATVHVVGSGTVPATTVPSGVTLSVDETLTMSGSGGGTGVTLQSGASLTTAPGATLTVNGFETALRALGSATVGDGHYSLYGAVNMEGSSVVRGSSRSALTMTIDGLFNPTANARVEHATISSTGHDTYESYSDRKPYLRLNDVSLTYKDFKLAPQVFEVGNSDLQISGRFSSGWTGGLVLLFSWLGRSYLQDSTLTVEGSRMNVANGSTLDVINSTLKVINSPDGGINVNHNGHLNINNSKLVGENITGSYSLVGIGLSKASDVTVTGSSTIDTAAATQNDSIGLYSGTYVVTGGSFNVYRPGVTNGMGIPTNGADHGNEALTYFTLADPEVTSLDVIDKNDRTYTYPVAQPSNDGARNVWVPAAKVTYELREASAAFADGTKGTNGTRVHKAMRGQTLSAAKAVNGTPQAAEGAPKAANGRSFAGWKYDVEGTPTVFNPETTKVTGDITVYATWSGEATSAVVNYAADANGGQMTTLTAPDKDKVTVASYEDVLRQNSQFVKEGYHFDHWSTDPEGKRQVKVGDLLTIADGQTPTLYANWAINTYTVRFSANGGTFSDSSPFKAKATKDKFKITTDARGGEVATLKDKVDWNTSVSSVFETAGADATDAQGVATRQHFHLHFDHECDSWCEGGWYGPTDTYWFLDPAAGTPVDTNAGISADTTYYLSWDVDDGVNTVQKHDNPLQAGLTLDVTSGKLAAGEPPLVESGATLTATGSLNVKPIQDQIEAIGKQLASNGDESGIELQGVTSGFTATLTLPEGITVDGSPKATLTANDLFTITGATASGNTVTVSLGLKDTYTDFQTLKKAVLAVPTTLDVTVSNLTVTGKAEPGSYKDLTAKGIVTGSFSGIATRNGGDVTRPLSVGGGATSVPAGKLGLAVERMAAAASSGVYYFDLGWTSNPVNDTVRLVEPASYVQSATLDGNISITHGKTTEDTKIVVVNSNDLVTWKGELDTQPIKDQIKTISQVYCGERPVDPNTVDKGACHDELANIHLKDVDSSFIATITLPDGVTPDKDRLAADAKFTDNELFEVKADAVKVKGQKVTIAMTLQKPSQYDNLQKLYDAVQKAPVTFTVQVPSTLTNAPAGKYTAVGEVNGTFKGLAYKDSGVGTRLYNISWNSKQREGGKDLGTAADDTRITGTLLVPTPVSIQDVSLPGDLSITTTGSDPADTTTQHDAVRMIGRGDGYVYDFTGTLGVTAIQDQIKLLAQQYCSDLQSADCQAKYEQISLDKVASNFVATLTLPDGLILPSQDVLNGVALSQNKLFKVTSVTRDSDTKVTVKMGLIQDGQEGNGSFTNFKQLLDAVTAVPAELSFTVPSVTVATKAATDTNLTATGTVAGTFHAVAYNQAEITARDYNISWKAEQTDAGRDSTRTAADKSITLTVNAGTATVPVTKKWELHNADIAGDAPSVKIQLRSKVGDAEAADVAGKTITLDQKSEWKGKFAQLNAYTPAGKAIDYSISEPELPAGFTSAVSGDAKDGFTVTNTLGSTKVAVTKQWKGIAANAAPAVEVELYANGKNTGLVKELNAAGEWKTEFTGLPATKADNSAITYTVKEKALAGYTSAVSGDATNGFTITNTKVEEPDPGPTDTPTSTPTPQPGKPGSSLARTGAAVVGTSLLAGGCIAVGALLLRSRRRN